MSHAKSETPQQSHENIAQHKAHHPPSDVRFYIGFGMLSAFYIGLIIAMLAADVWFAEVGGFMEILRDENIRYAIKLSLISCTISTILALWVAVPIGYLMSRTDFPGKNLLDSILDIPIVLPPLVIGLSLLVLFRQTFLKPVDDWLGIAFHVPAVIVAQFSVAAAFAVRTLRGTFDEMSRRPEQVALTLGCSRSQAFWMVVFPEAKLGLLTAGTLAWARSLGEFGPILVFAGSTRRKTEVLPVSVHLELSYGNIDRAVAVAMLMVIMAVTVLVVTRTLTGRDKMGRGFQGMGRQRD